MENLRGLLILVVCVVSLGVVASDSIEIKPSTNVKSEVGKRIILTCLVETNDDRTPSLVWKFAGSQISEDSQMMKYQMEVTSVVGRSSFKLTINDCQLRDTGTYTCEDFGSSLTMDASINVYTRPNITATDDQIITPGVSMVLTCLVSTNSPVIWNKNGADSLKELGLHDVNMDGKDDVQVLSNNSLIILDPSDDDIGNYECTVFFQVGGDVLQESKRIRIYALETEACSLTAPSSVLVMVSLTWTLYLFPSYSLTSATT